MTPEEQKYQEELKAGGVELPELNEKPKIEEIPKIEEKPKAEEKPIEDKPKVEDKPKIEEKPKIDEEPRKRSIYDDLKDRKKDLKEEREAREEAERQVTELKQRVENLEKARNPEDKKEAQDEIDKFIADHKEWDKPAIADLVSLVRKGVKPESAMSAEDRKVIEDARLITAKGNKDADKQSFETEYQATAPSIKEMFPQATVEELSEVKKTLEGLAHSKGWHDKELDYIVFKNKDILSKLISPKTRGLEPKGKQDIPELPANFDPNADYSKMGLKEREIWEEQYRKVTSHEGLVEDAQGRKLLI